MKGYEYHISLVVQHPSMDVEAISNSLKLRPSGAGNVGEAKVTRKGRVLSSVHKKTEWWYDPHGKENLTEEYCFIENYLLRLIKEFEEHREFFGQVVSSGGEVSLNVGWFSGDRSMLMSLPLELLKELSSLSVSLGLSVYED